MYGPDFTGASLDLASPACLPPSLTHLGLRYCALEELPGAVAALTQASDCCAQALSAGASPFLLNSTLNAGLPHAMLHQHCAVLAVLCLEERAPWSSCSCGRWICQTTAR